nr:hypothetical protein [Kribbella italica]
MRSSAVRGRTLTTAAAFLVVLAGCSGGGETNKGGLPIGVDDQPDSNPTITLPTPPPQSTPAPRPTSAKPTTAKPPAATAKVVVVPGRFGAEPAVQGLVAKYPLYYQALVSRNSDIVKTGFPAIFYAGTATDIEAAKDAGWLMRPPGSIVVIGTSKQPYGVVRVNLCRSQRLQWWNPKTRKFVVNAPKGTGEAIDMVRTGFGWTMYRMVRPIPAGINCATVRYPV